MAICYLVPGILGSELYLQSLSGRRIWLSYVSLALNGFEQLRLDGAGLNPADRNQARLVPGPPLERYYGQCVEYLKKGLEPHGFKVVPWGYDWRLDLLTNGNHLAQEIYSNQDNRTDPCSIVGHSMGGLVARIAWRQLVKVRCESYCRRIVTVGTPHFGSWSAAQLLIGTERILHQVGAVANNLALNFWAPNPETVAGSWIQTYAASVAATWPSVYQLLPALHGSAFDRDPSRELYYGLGGYPDLPWVKQAHLDDAKNTWQPILADPSSRPPPLVLRCAGSDAYVTANDTRKEANGAVVRGAWTAGRGDSVVTAENSTLPGASLFTAPAAHQELPGALAATGDLANLVLDDEPPPDPQPDQVEVDALPRGGEPGLVVFLADGGGPGPKKCGAS